ncbi:MAG TPA: hypothetical protein ENG34_00140 [Candidatus Aenigmarchaeota archaeon]|nr:hypothetical protein [Candidatus Aenigmarchaeota archaeon]
MSEIRVVFKKGGKIKSGTTHGGVALRLFSALSFDPKDPDELFVKGTNWYWEGSPKEAIEWDKEPTTEPHDSGVIIFDFDNKKVILNQTYFSPARYGFTNFHPEFPDSWLSNAVSPYAIPRSWGIVDKSEKALEVDWDRAVSLEPFLWFSEKTVPMFSKYGLGVTDIESADKISVWDLIKEFARYSHKGKLEEVI